MKWIYLFFSLRYSAIERAWLFLQGNFVWRHACRTRHARRIALQVLQNQTLLRDIDKLLLLLSIRKRLLLLDFPFHYLYKNFEIYMHVLGTGSKACSQASTITVGGRSAGVGKSSWKHSKSLIPNLFIQSETGASRLTSTPTAIAPAHTSCCLATSETNTAGSVPSRRRDFVINWYLFSRLITLHSPKSHCWSLSRDSIPGQLKLMQTVNSLMARKE